MGGPKLLSLVFAVGAAILAGWSPARSQCRLCVSPTTSRGGEIESGDVRLEVESSLNFDQLILSGAGDGAAILRPDGSRSVEGAVTNLGPRAMVGAVVVRGEPNRLVRVDLPHRITLYSLSGGQILFEDVASDLPALPRLDSAGNLSFRFGGRLRVTGDADGAYRGDLPITVEYP